MTGKEFAYLRKTRFTVTGLAETLGVTRRTLQRVERSTTVPTLYVLALRHLIHEKEMDEIFPHLTGMSR